jgi:hypothetical protein
MRHSRTVAKREHNASITLQSYWRVSRFSRQFRSSSQVLLEIPSHEQNSATSNGLKRHDLQQPTDEGRQAKLKNSRVPRALCSAREQNRQQNSCSHTTSMPRCRLRENPVDFATKTWHLQDRLSPSPGPSTLNSRPSTLPLSPHFPANSPLANRPPRPAYRMLPDAHGPHHANPSPPRLSYWNALVEPQPLITSLQFGKLVAAARIRPCGSHRTQLME